MENWLFAEYDYDEDVAVQREEAAEEAAEAATVKTTEKINMLIQKLLADNRTEDLRKSTEDTDFQHQLMVEYGIIDE